MHKMGYGSEVTCGLYRFISFSGFWSHLRFVMCCLCIGLATQHDSGMVALVGAVGQSLSGPAGRELDGSFPNATSATTGSLAGTYPTSTGANVVGRPAGDGISGRTSVDVFESQLANAVSNRPPNQEVGSFTGIAELDNPSAMVMFCFRMWNH